MQMGRMINKHGTMYVTRKKREVSNDQKLGTSFYFKEYMQMIGQTNLHV